MAGRGEVEIPVLQNEISDIRTTIGLRTDTVTSLELSVASLLTDVKGLMATGDGGVYGETYANDNGPAVRAKMFEEAIESTIARLRAAEEATTNVITMGQEQANMNKVEWDKVIGKILKFENELRDFRLGTGASVHGVPAARRDKKGVTEMKGFEKMKHYTGEATQWKDWRFKMTTWLAQCNPSFESLLSKLDERYRTQGA